MRAQIAALPGPQLQAEHDRLRAVIAQAPQLWLERRIAAVRRELKEAERIAAVAAAHRDRAERQRRWPTRSRGELASARADERLAAAAAAELAEELHALTVQVAGDRWPTDHADDLARFAAIRDRLADRARIQAMRARHTDIPDYLTVELGDRPANLGDRALWDRAAIRIEHYRHTHDITDQHHALGERPRDHAARRAHDQARHDINHARARLGRHRVRTRAPEPPTPPSRGYGIGHGL